MLDPEKFALFSEDEELDYAIVALGRRSSGEAVIEDLGYCPLSDRDDKHRIGMFVNIIQHPSGWPKMIAVRNNLLTHRTPRTLLYETDTENGSSGSPVFNDDWEVVALHHWGEPFLERRDENGNQIPVTVNEGVRISAIFKDLVRRVPELTTERQALLRAALEAHKSQSIELPGRALGPPRPSEREAGSRASIDELTLMSTPRHSFGDHPSETREFPHTMAQELRFTIPIEVSIRIGGNSLAHATPETAVVLPSRVERSLRRGAERVSIDRDYSNRKGYDRRFIPGLPLSLPEPGDKLARQVAPLQVGEPNAEVGELKYQNFSLKLHKSRRMAIFTATNIDGETYLKVDRGSGLVVDSSEGETWYKDPRINESYYLLQPFYSDWSDYFDRGHLTRRTDPTWGTPEAAERANVDTFHFTNCSPQHFRFNQTAKYWQGAERYILEKGALAEDTRNRICVFQGPIFNDQIDRYADDVQIPSSFFKVVVWKGRQGPRAVGLIVDQAELLDERRKNLGKPKDDPPVSVKQWRKPIPTIEKQTDLDFGDAVRQADTWSDSHAPNVGEALVLLRGFEDILS